MTVSSRSGTTDNIMPVQGPQWTDFLSCQVCYKLFSERANRPISLGCGHTVCKMCLSRLQQSKCPFDQSIINCDIDKLPVNYALLQLVGAAVPDKVIDEEDLIGDLSDAKKTECYESARKCIEEVAVYLKPLSEESINELEKTNEDMSDLKISKTGSQSHIQNIAGKIVSVNAVAHSSNCVLSRPMQRKLVMLINCQLVEEEGRSRAARAARSLGERTVTELILAHQNPQQLSANLWAAVRTRGCQFLGPGMQEEVLRLILLALEEGSALSRKVLVLFVVQRLEKQYPQASKTAIGHVVQLLYRASCFRVTKREEESSLMQLKEEFRTYEALRLEHDAQIVQIAMEAGLRISPEQWSSLLYGDTTHKSHMQSIIDKHQSPQSFAQGINELVMALQRTGDSCNLLGLKPHLDFLAKIDPSPDCPAPSWEDLEAVMKSLKIVIQGLVDFVMRYNHRKPEIPPQQNARYKTSLCRDFSAKLSCPRGQSCTFAHSQDELEKYRSRSKKMSHRGSGSVAAFASLTPKQKLELAQVQESSRQKMETTVGRPGASHVDSAGVVPNSNAVAAAQLTAQMMGMAINPGVQQRPAADHAPGSGFPVGANPGGAFHGVQPRLPASGPMMRPMTSLNAGAGAEGMYADQLHSYHQQAAMRMPVPNELGVPYHNAHIPVHPMQGPSPPLMSSTVYRSPAPVMPGPSLQQPLAGAMQPGHVTDIPQVPALAPGAPCPHMHAPGELMQQAAPVYHPVGAVPNPGVIQVPEQQFVVGPGGDLQAMAPAAVPAMPTLERLQNRKSEIISHLKSEGLSVGDLPAVGMVSSLDMVLARGPRPRAGPMSNSVSDSFVAARTTNKLDDLDLDKYPSWSAGEVVQPRGDDLSPCNYSGYQPQMSCPATEHINSFSPHYQPTLRNLGAPPSYVQHVQSAVTSCDEQRVNVSKKDNILDKDLVEDGELKELDLPYIGAILDDDDDSFIPFDPPLVSKFGPISRNARVKGRDTDPVQVTADETVKRCTPVLSVTPINRPYPTSAPVPSMYKPQMHTSVVPISTSAPAPVQPANTYSFWAGQDWFQLKIPEMVHELEKSAVRASTTSERLALQLQAVELQISMKTGLNPKPVHQILKEAVQWTSRNGEVPAHTMSDTSVSQDRTHTVAGARYMPGDYPTEWK